MDVEAQMGGKSGGSWQRREREESPSGHRAAAGVRFISATVAILGFQRVRQRGVSSVVMGFSPERDQSAIVNDSDFEHLWRLIEMKEGGPDWHEMMDQKTPTMTHQAWRRDPQAMLCFLLNLNQRIVWSPVCLIGLIFFFFAQFLAGPPQYRGRTVYEDATPELVRDFFWDDEFRTKWDDMLIHAATLDKWKDTLTMIVHWIRKFPFFCSDREYIIGRRIWQT